MGRRMARWRRMNWRRGVCPEIRGWGVSPEIRRWWVSPEVGGWRGVAPVVGRGRRLSGPVPPILRPPLLIVHVTCWTGLPPVTSLFTVQRL